MRRDRVDGVKGSIAEQRPVLLQLLPLADEIELPRKSDWTEVAAVELLDELMIAGVVPARVPVNEKSAGQTIQPGVGKPGSGALSIAVPGRKLDAG